MNTLDAAFNFQASALRLRAQRQELLAANIANADTPNYKARDFDFSAALKNAIADIASASVENKLIATNTSSPMHLISTNAVPTSPQGQGDIQYRGMLQASMDGNTVDMDVERNQFTDNAIRYEASVMMVNGNIKQMLAAIQGQ